MARQKQYRLLAEELAAAIASGVHPVGSRLPTEAQLCADHRLSRGTVRQALRHLEEQGLIHRRPGAGTTVLRRRPLEQYVPVITSGDEVVRMVRRTRILDPVSREVRADAALAARLRVPEGSHWFLVEGARVLRDDPAAVLCWNEQYLNGELPQESREVMLAGTFTASAMNSTRIEQEVRADLIHERLAGPLAVPRGSPALVVVRRYWSPVRLSSISVHTHAADRFSITSELAVPGAG